MPLPHGGSSEGMLYRPSARPTDHKQAIQLTQGFLLEDKKHRVNQLHIFREIVELGHVSLDSLPCEEGITNVVQRRQFLCPPRTATDGIKDAIVPNRGKELFNKQGEQRPTDDGQVEVVDQKQIVEFVGWPASHSFSAAEDDDVV